jgi:hypothetical protein
LGTALRIPYSLQLIQKPYILSNSSDQSSKKDAANRPAPAQAELLYSLVIDFAQIAHEHPCFDFGR